MMATIDRKVHALRTRRLFLGLALGAFAAGAVAAEGDRHIMVTPNDLKWSSEVPSLPKGAQVAVIQGPLNVPGPFTIRLKFPAGYELPAHWHPAVEHVTVLSGTFHMGLGDKLEKSKTHALHAGSMMIMLPETRHFAWTQGETLIQVHGVGPWGINYVNLADDPRRK